MFFFVQTYTIILSYKNNADYIIPHISKNFKQKKIVNFQICIIYIYTTHCSLL